MTHHPTQRSLIIARANREAAQRKATELRAVRTTSAERARTAVLDAERARGELRLAAGDKAAGTGTDEAVVAARAALREKQALAEEAELEAEGVASRLQRVEDDEVSAERAVDQLAADVCVLMNARIEAEAIEAARRLGVLLGRRKRLAVAAHTWATSARGGDSTSPIIGAFGEQTDFSRKVKELIEATPEQGIVLDDLLEAELTP